MHGVERVVDVEHDAARHLAQAVAVVVDHGSPMRSRARASGRFSRREMVGCEHRSPSSGSTICVELSAVSMAAALRLSWACPSVSLIAIGKPWASTSACILVFRPAPRAPHALGSSVVPSLGPEWRANPLFELAAVLVHADRAGIDHLDVAIIGPRHCLEEAIPHLDLGPAPELVGAGGGRPVARPKPPIDAVQHLAVVRTGNPRVCLAKGAGSPTPQSQTAHSDADP